ncbi:MAG: DUF1464 family protein [Candidatus Nezhaarchaeota archaeon]|nr:DUF1464 family protein [Candidatus Nezhaarchaeota archaeon]MCX8141348.1 DUF1464 family protein [Candidatus Nezhaarchaeota archaeon]MDW8049614.1 DUF1464 family protein [Nitrososphaerota archaeon]
MVKVLGVDPGTFSFDICGLENGEVFYEKVIPTPEIAKRPESLIEGLEEAGKVDLITGPSGYGVKITHLKDVKDPEAFALNDLLLVRPEDVEKALKRGDLGIMVYQAMVKATIEMKRRNMPICFIPAVVHLPTVPWYRKINKIDMGTADKMCIAVLGVYDQSRRLGLNYSEVSFILVEMGFGYNAVIGVEGGRIVDGIGGTMGHMGFLTAGGLDAELVQLVGNWEKSDIFTGGISTVAKVQLPEQLVERAKWDEVCRAMMEAMVEGIEKMVASMMVSVRKPREILLSGRLTRINEIERMVKERLSRYGEVRQVGWLKGAKTVKEAAQGYAMVADGLAGGVFKKLIEWMRIPEASGTSLDYIFHPKKSEIKLKLLTSGTIQ